MARWSARIVACSSLSRHWKAAPASAKAWVAIVTVVVGLLVVTGSFPIVYDLWAPRHEAVRLEFPVLVSVRSKPLPAVVVPLVGKPDGNPVVVKRPELLDEAIVQLSDPLPREKLDNRRTTGQKLRAIAPDAVQSVAPRDSLGVTGVPGVLGESHLRHRGFPIERRTGWAGGLGRHLAARQPRFPTAPDRCPRRSLRRVPWTDSARPCPAAWRE
jgi:hypothetical protein